MALEVAKSSWLYRQSKIQTQIIVLSKLRNTHIAGSILKRWKSKWFVLYKDGILRFFESPDRHVSDEVFNISRDCLSIRRAQFVSNYTPPSYRSTTCLFEVVLKKETLVLCADSPDDMVAWCVALEQAKNFHLPRSNSIPSNSRIVYQSYGGSQRLIIPDSGQIVVYANEPVPNGQPQAYLVRGSPGSQIVHYPNNQVVFVSDPYRERNYRGDVALGMIAGAATGMALGSLFWTPLFFC